MAAPIIAAGAAVAARPVIESATDDQGLVNQAFKITILIGLALALAFSLYLLYIFVPAFNAIFETLATIAELVGSVATLPGLITTGLLSGTTFGRGLFNLRLLRNR